MKRKRKKLVRPPANSEIPNASGKLNLLVRITNTAILQPAANRSEPSASDTDLRPPIKNTVVLDSLSVSSAVAMEVMDITPATPAQDRR